MALISRDLANAGSSGTAQMTNVFKRELGKCRCIAAAYYNKIRGISYIQICDSIVCD